MSRAIACLAAAAALLAAACDDAPPAPTPEPPVMTRDVAGPIAVDTVWQGDRCPVHVVADVSVAGPDAPVLRIVGPCEVRFEPNTGLRVGFGDPGGLRVEGTAGATVTFAPVSGAIGGAWGGLALGPSTTASIAHAAVIAAGGVAAGSPVDGAITVSGEGARVHLDHVTVRDSAAHGLYLQEGGRVAAGSSTLTISGCARYGVSAPAGQIDSVPTTAHGARYADNAAGALEVRGGEIEASAEWTELATPYVITGDVRVGGPAAPRLTIAPGVVLAFWNDVHLRVGDGQAGALWVRGAADRRARFTAARNPGRGAWGGVVFEADTVDADTTLEFVDVEHAGGGASGDDTRACVSIRGAAPTLRHATITACAGNGVTLGPGGGLGPGSTALTVTDNQFAAVRATPDAAGTLPSADSSYTGNGEGGPTIDEGVVTSSATWRALDTAWVVRGPVDVGGPSSPVLTVELGARLRFQAGAALRSGARGEPGAIAAVGTSSSPIVFTADGALQRGAWGGLWFGPDTVDAASILEHVVVEFGGGPIAGQDTGGDVVTQDAAPTLRASRLWRARGCGLVTTCTSSGGGPALIDVLYGSGPDANEAGGLCNHGC